MILNQPNDMILHGCYRFTKKWMVVEMTLPCTPDDIDWFGFSVPEEGVDEFNRQTPYMEQYLTPDGTDKLCDAWDEPEEQNAPTRVAFFLHRTEQGTTLETPYGNVSLTDLAPLPERLTAILEFENE